MNPPATRHAPLSVEDYLRHEEVSSVRHEYVPGVVYALAGTTRRHNRIAGNIDRRLGNAAGGGACGVYIENVKLRATKDIFYYPDVMVACGPEAEDPYIEESPCVIVEVISPSTEMVDRREKAWIYRQIPTLEGYIIVDQERRRVTRHWREEDGVWWHAEVAGRSVVPIPCPELTLTLDEIYEGTDAPA